MSSRADVGLEKRKITLKKLRHDGYLMSIADISYKSDMADMEECKTVLKKLGLAYKSGKCNEYLWYRGEYLRQSLSQRSEYSDIRDMLGIALDRLEVPRCSWHTSDGFVPFVFLLAVSAINAMIILLISFISYKLIPFLLFTLLIVMLMFFGMFAFMSVLSSGVFYRIVYKVCTLMGRCNYNNHRKMQERLFGNPRLNEYNDILKIYNLDNREYIKALVGIELLYIDVYGCRYE